MINFRFIIYILGIQLILLGGVMFVPAGADLMASHPGWIPFAVTGAITMSIGAGLYFTHRGFENELSAKDSLLLTFLSWISTSIFSSFPLFFSHLHLSFTDAYFETISGLTTTGATVLTHLDGMSHGILLWRGLLQWGGGIGIIVLAIVILPNLGIGGMRLFYSESSDRSDKPLPRFKPLAARIALIYFALTLACTGAFVLAGMTKFEAVVHAMTTLSTGGFSTSDQSIGHFPNAAVQWICMVFMVLGSLPYILYIQTLQGKRSAIWADGQVRFFLGFLLAIILPFSLWLWKNHNEPLWEALQHVAFHVISVVTTTGFTTTDYSLWGTLAFDSFFFLTFIGGCSGSTAGGIKIFRFKVMLSVIRVQIIRLIQPRAVVHAKFNGKTIPPETVQSVLSFFSLYLFILGLLAIGLSVLGLDFVTSASGAATALSNVGPGLGPVIGPGGNFAPLGDSAKWLLSFGMLVGRLELFTVIILFAPRFWKT